jgi:hypothetical protein
VRADLVPSHNIPPTLRQLLNSSMGPAWRISQPYCLALGPQINSPEPIWYCGCRVLDGQDKICEAFPRSSHLASQDQRLDGPRANMSGASLLSRLFRLQLSGSFKMDEDNNQCPKSLLHNFRYWALIFRMRPRIWLNVGGCQFGVDG